MSKRKVAPSEKVAKLIERLLNGEHGLELDGSGLLGRLAQLGAQQVIQEALEKEQAENVERGRYERRSEGKPTLYRNGYEVGRSQELFRTPEGEVLLSRTSASEITDALWEEYEAFSQRALSGLPVVYLIVDGVYEAMRRLGQVRDGILVAWGICRPSFDPAPGI